MSAQQGLAPLNKKCEIVLSDGSFVSVFRLTAGAVATVQRMPELSDFDKIVLLVQLSTKVDDREFTIKEILNMDLEDFNLISNKLMS